MHISKNELHIFQYTVITQLTTHGVLVHLILLVYWCNHMKLNPSDTKPWAKDYFEQIAEGLPQVQMVLKGKVTGKKGMILETEACKTYLFPGSYVFTTILKWLEDNHGKEVDALAFSSTEKYPYFEITDETGEICHVHITMDGNITLTPIPLNESPKATKKQKG